MDRRQRIASDYYYCAVLLIATAAQKKRSYGVSSQKNTGFRVASEQHSLCISFALQSAPMSKGSDTSSVAAFIAQRVGLGLGYSRLEIKDAKNKACT
jgi:hypothetical protein